MFEHRLRDYFAPSSGAVLTAPASPVGFVPCPCPVFAGFSLPQQALVAEVYRLARAMTEAQLREAARTFPPAFSLN